MKEEFKKFLNKKNITEEQFGEKSALEMGALYNEFYQEQLAQKANKGDIPSIEDALKDYLKADAMKTIEKQIEEINESVNLLKDAAGSEDAGEGLTLKQAVAKAIREKADEIKALKENRSGNVQIKAVGSMTLAGNVTGRVGRVEREAGSYGVQRRNPFLMQIVNVANTNAQTYVYVERNAHEGGPAMTAEGAVKPQADWNYVEKTANPVKVAVIVTISKEMLDDIDGIIADVNMEIDEQTMLLADEKLLTGDGTSNNPVGIDENATAFVAGNLANTVTTANKHDVLRAGIAQVMRSNFDATHILLSVDDAASMELEKGTDGHYVLPPFTSADGTRVKGLPVVVNNGITDDDFYVGDFSKFKVRVREGITMDVGYRGAAGDWEKNMVSFLGEMRFFAFIPANHYGAIVKGDFTTAQALLDPDVADA